MLLPRAGQFGRDSRSRRRLPVLPSPAAIRIAAVRLLKSLQWQWRSSLQLRVVSTTLVVSAVVISLLGFFLMQQIASNLLGNAEARARTQASDGLVFAQNQPGAAQLPGSNSETMAISIVHSLQSSGQAGADYGVAITVLRDLVPAGHLDGVL